MGTKLGKRYRDTITGFEGTATGRAEYLYGCVQILLTGQSKEGAEPVSRWFDEPGLEGVTSRAKVGGPQHVPTPRHP